MSERPKHRIPTFYADSSNIGDIAGMIETGIISGITTNQGIFVKDNPDKDYNGFIDHIKTMLQEFPGKPISIQLPDDDEKALVRLAEEWAKISENVVIKVPFLNRGRGIALTGKLTRVGIKVNVTGLMKYEQVLPALIAGRVGESNGPTYISLFYNRIKDTASLKNYNPELHGSSDPRVEIQRSRERIDLPKDPFSTMIIAGSIRKADDIVRASDAGAHIVTIPPARFWEMLGHPQTEKFIEESQASWKKITASKIA